jgi:hypothetical protein
MKIIYIFFFSIFAFACHSSDIKFYDKLLFDENDWQERFERCCEIDVKLDEMSVVLEEMERLSEISIDRSNQIQGKIDTCKLALGYHGKY